MAPAVSKLSTLPFNCYELGHTWSPSCPRAAADVGFYCFREGFKIYTWCYALTLLARRHFPKSRQDALKVLKDIVRSSAFLSTNGAGFLFFVCLIRKILGSSNFFTVGYVPAFLASYAAILVEKPQRRPLLALYVTNVASDTLFRMLRTRGILGNIKHFDFIMFIFSSTALLYHMKKGSYKSDVITTVFKKILGKEEFTKHPQLEIDTNVLNQTFQSAKVRAASEAAIIGYRDANNLDPALVVGEHDNETKESRLRRMRKCRKRDSSYGPRFIRFVFWMHSQRKDIAFHLERMAIAVYQGQSHDTCPHEKPCFTYWTEGFVTRFASGFGIQVAIELIMFLRRTFLNTTKLVSRSPPLPRSSSFTKCLKTGAGLSSVCMCFRLLSCAFRWLLGNDYPIHWVAAGVMTSGFGFALLKPPPSLGLYLLFKAAEVVIADSHRRNEWKIINWFDSSFGGGWCLLYAISTAMLFHAGMLEPQNLKPSYFSFLSKVTGGKFLNINRHLMSVYGTQSNLLMKDFWPVFDRRFISGNMKELIDRREYLGIGNENIKELTMKYVGKSGY